MLVSGDDTAGAYTLIDMHVPPGGGPPPHRHDFEEMFSVLDGELEVTFCGTTMLARAGETVNVPANAPHAFRNVGAVPARLLCLCAPAGQEEFFLEVGQRVASSPAEGGDGAGSPASGVASGPQGYPEKRLRRSRPQHLWGVPHAFRDSRYGERFADQHLLRGPRLG